VLLFCLIFEPSWASNWEGAPKGSWTFRVGPKMSSLETQITEKDSLAPRVIYKPNFPGEFLLSASYSIFSVTASTTGSENENQPKENFGKTSGQDIQLRFFGSQWTPELTYQRYRGYYLDNMEEIDPSWDSSQPHELRPNMTMSHIGLSFFYNHNPSDFSLGVLSSSTRQKKTSGSWLSIFSLNYHELSDDLPFVPAIASSNYGDFQDVSKIKILHFSFTPGAAGALVWKNWFLGGMFGLGLGVNQVTTNAEDAKPRVGAGARVFARAGLGYHGDIFMSGIAFFVDSLEASAENAKLTANPNVGYVYVGFRITDLEMPWVDKMVSSAIGD